MPLVLILQTILLDHLNMNMTYNLWVIYVCYFGFIFPKSYESRYLKLKWEIIALPE